MTWFEQLTGILETSPTRVRDQLTLDDDCLICPSGKRLAFGALETPTLAELRDQVRQSDVGRDGMSLREQVADVKQLHADEANAGALFQVASQFNLLEMASPSVTPDAGVGIYENDHTQGPTCAIACGAGTIFRNYFATVGGATGQSAALQIDCAADLGRRLGNEGDKLWSMQNGYLFPSDAGLDQISTAIQMADDEQREQLLTSLRIGVQWNAAVTLTGCTHRVSQAYCSALPVAYGRQPEGDWEDFARLVLQSAYESTFCAAIVNSARTGCNKLFLTLLGGGVFGNRNEWITDSIEHSVKTFHDFNLDVAIVSYGGSKPAVADLVRRF